MQQRRNLILLGLVLLGGAIALWLAPEQTTTKTGAEGALSATEVSMSQEGTFGLYTLAVSWQPAFCETEPGKAECRTLGPGQYAADHFTLHGLWPPEQYCGVTPELVAADANGPRSALPAVQLSGGTRKALDRIMPGTQSHLDRHEWLMHGSCAGVAAEQYYRRAIAFLDTLNASPVRQLFVGNSGKTLSSEAIRTSFDKAFGRNAGDRVRIDCAADGSRDLVVELRIRLYGKVMASTPFEALIARASPSGDGCAGGIVDHPGDQ